MDELMPDNLVQTAWAQSTGLTWKTYDLPQLPRPPHPPTHHLHPPAPNLIQAFPLWTPAGVHPLIALCTIKQTWTS